jgi:anti-sigma regulatory factor (Ser/Thr protein kinase)
VESLLEAWGLLRLRNDAKLLTSELVTNAVLHAGTDLTITVARDDERQVLRVTVGDGSDTPPSRRFYSALATTGRGLAMVSHGAQAFGVDPLQAGKAGKAVWFELALSAASPAGPGAKRDY